MDIADLAPLLIPLIGTIVLAFLTMIPSLIVIRRDRRKVQAESNKATAESESFVVDAARSLVEPLKQRITELERVVQEQARRLAEQDKRIGELEHVAAEACDGATRLTLQLQSLRQVPNWTMPPMVEAWHAGGSGR